MSDGGNRPVTIFRDRPRLLLFFVVLGLIFIVQGIATAGYFVFFDDGAGFRLVGILLSLFLVLVGVFFGGYALIRIRARHAPITVGPDGLHDRIISARPIPWSDILDVRIWPAPRGGPVVVFDIVDGAAERAGVFRRAKFETGVNRAFSYTYQIHAMGTDASIDRLVEAIRPYAEVRGD